MNKDTFSPEEEENINIQKYIFLFLANWRWFVITILFGLIIAFVVNRYSTPVYETKNTVMVTEKEDAMGAMSSIMKELGTLGGGSNQNIDNFIGILQSYTLTKQTLERLNYQISYRHEGRVNDVEIYNECPIRIELDTVFKERIKELEVEFEDIFITILSSKKYQLNIPRDSNSVSKTLLFNQQYTSDEYVFSVVKSDAFEISEKNNKDNIIDETYIATINNYHKLTRQYLNNLTVEASFKKGTILDLTFQGTVPEKVVNYLNTLILVAIENDLKEKNKTSYKTIEFIDSQLMEIVDSLNKAEQNLETFRSANKIIDLSIEGSALFEKIEEFQSQKSMLEIRLKYYQYILKTIQKKDNLQDMISPSVIGVQDPSLNSLITQLGELYAEKQVIKYSATDQNPSLKLINIKINNTIESLIDNVHNLIESTKLELDEIDKEIAKLNINIKKLPKTERELINIQRRFELNDNIYNYLLQKRAEVGITKAANLPDLKFIDEAFIENTKLISPKRALNYLIALFLACFIPGIIIILRDFLNNKIVEREEIEQSCSIPILGSVAHNRREEEFVPVKKHPKSSIAESFRTIRTSISFFLKRIKYSTPIISFTSTVSGEGKTFCALNLATMIAMNNKRVLIVGLDLRKPRLHTMINTNFTLGVTNFLIGKNTIEDITIKSDISQNLDIILSGPVPPNPLELIESKEFSLFIDQIQNQKYDYIIFDTPPIGLVADTLSISKHSDLNVFVMRQNYTNKNSLKFINDVHKEGKVVNLSILINDVDMINSYGYRYGKYGQQYGYGYYDDEHLMETNFFKRIYKNIFNLH
ncbi:MAG: polysaccharide biosynthesis tyrosine autokinase [Bacteroidales bacterium]